MSGAIGSAFAAGSAPDLMERVAALSERGRLDAALECCEQAQAADPRRGGAVRLQARLFVRQGRLREAARGYRRAIELDHDDAESCLELARLIMRSFARADIAVAYLTHSTRLMPDNGGAWFDAGVAQARIGKLERARGAFDRAIALGHRIADAHCEIAALCKASGRHAAALSAYRAALAAEPGNPRARAGLAPPAQPGAGSKRVGLFMRYAWHECILGPVHAALDPHHLCLGSGDPLELADFDPQLVVMCDLAAVPLRDRFPRARFVTTRHGLGLVSKNYSAASTRSHDYACASSAFERDFLSARGVRPRRRFWVTGLVQMDRVFRDAVALPCEIASGRTMILYAPTYNALMGSGRMLGGEVADLVRAGCPGALLVIKPHPHAAEQTPELIRTWRRLAENDPQVRFLEDNRVDVAPLMRRADLLITDVSNLMFQFLAMDRPLVLINNPRHREDGRCYDPQGIEWQWRDVGEQIDDAAALPAAIARALADPCQYGAARARYRERLFGELTDGCATQRLLAHVTALDMSRDDAAAI